MRLRFGLLLAVLVYAILPLPADAGQPAGEAGVTSSQVAARLSFVIQGALANEEAIRQYACDVHLARGHSPSPESALRSGPTENVHYATGRQAVDGDMLVYERASNERLRPTAEGGELLAMTLPSWSLLKKGDLVLSYSPEAYCSTIDRGREFRGVDLTTWNAGGLIKRGDGGSFGRYTSQILQNHPDTLRLDDASTIVSSDGASLTKVIYEFEQLRFEWSIDEDRGFLPLETAFFAGGVEMARCYITDVEELDGNWFPTRSVKVTPKNRPSGNGKYDVLEIKVTNLRGTPPGESDFAISLPENSFVNNQDDARSQFRLTSVELIAANDLVSLHERSIGQANKGAGGSGSSIAASTWILLGLGAVISIAAFVFLAKGRKGA